MTSYIFGRQNEYRIRSCRDSDFSQIASSIEPASSNTRAGRMHRAIYDSDGSGNFINGEYQVLTAQDMFHKSLIGNDTYKERLLVITDSDESESIFWAFFAFSKSNPSSDFYRGKRMGWGIPPKFRGNPVHRTGKRIWDIVSIDFQIAIKKPDFLYPMNELWGNNNLDPITVKNNWRIRPRSAVNRNGVGVFSQIKLREEMQRVGSENFKNDKTKFISGSSRPTDPMYSYDSAQNFGFLNYLPYVWDSYDSAEAEYL